MLGYAVTLLFMVLCCRAVQLGYVFPGAFLLGAVSWAVVVKVVMDYRIRKARKELERHG